jgi:hypothetical protein
MRSISTERGMALVVVLAAILLLSTLGAALLLATTAESLIAAHFRTGVEALAAADAMLVRTISDLRAVSDWSEALSGGIVSPFLDGPTSGTRRLPDGSTIDLVRLVNQANCGRDAACRASEMDAVTIERPWGANNPRWRVFASGTMPALAGDPSSGPSLYLVALIADDGMENDGDPERDGGGGAANPGLGVMAIRAEAFAPIGTHRAVQATVARDDTVCRRCAF